MIPQKFSPRLSTGKITWPRTVEPQMGIYADLRTQLTIITIFKSLCPKTGNMFENISIKKS